MALLFLAAVALFTIPVLLQVGHGETYEFIESDGWTMTYTVMKGGETTQKVIYLSVCYTSMSTNEMIWTNGERQRLLDQGTR